MRKQKFKDTWPSHFIFERIRLMVDKWATMDSKTMTITYKVRDYHKLDYHKRGMSNVWVEKKLTKEEAQAIFLDLYPEGTLV